MIVKDFVYLNDNFKPIYDLKHESGEYWKQYISNEQFETLLKEVYSSLYSSQVKDRLSIWLHGTYGTGKSHATGVIKKLLTSKWENVRDYVQESIRSSELKKTIEKYCKELPIFPVVLKGVSNVYNSFTFQMEIQKAVSEKLKASNINVATKTEFENYAQKIENDKSNTWDIRLREWDCLVEQGIQSKEELIKKLRAYDKSLIYNLKLELEKEQIDWALPSITEWLSDLTVELKHRGIAEKIVIFWDEFTSIMNLHNEIIIEQIRTLAELSFSNNVYLLLISHQTSNIAKSSDERGSIKKMEAGFKKIPFAMMEVTTFHLLENAIKISNKGIWDEAISYYDAPIRQSIKEIDTEYSEKLYNMFPLHPYTAYIANYIARQIGSTERSIFKFLYDEENGFKNFIENCNDKNKMLCTSDYIFRFFLKDFEDSTEEQIKNILHRYSYSYKTVEKFNKFYDNLLQGLMLLNIAHRLLNTVNDNHKKIVPTQNNLKLMFRGSHLEKEISGFFDLLDEKEIISKDYDGRYLVESTLLDSQKVNQHKNSLEKKYKTVLDMLNSEQEKSIYSNILKSPTFRRQEACKIELINAGATATEISQKIKKLNKEPKFTLKVMLALTNNFNNCGKFIETVKSFQQDTRINDSKNIVFAVAEKELFDAKDVSRFIDLKAKQEVAQKQKAIEEETNYSIQVDDLVKKLITNFKSDAQVSWLLFTDAENLKKGKSAFNKFGRELDQQISSTIFYKSFDTMPKKLGVVNIWKNKSTQKLLLRYLTSSSLKELESNITGQDAQTRNILETEAGVRIVKDNLKFERAYHEHPLYILKEHLRTHLKKGKVLNIADILSNFIKPPYGMYSSMVFFAAMGYCFQPYVGKIYMAENGIKCSAQNLTELITKAFDYHCKGSTKNKAILNIRIGSDEEDKLKNILNEIFKLPETDSLQQTKYQLMDFFKANHNYPLWLYENVNHLDGDIVDTLDMLQNDILLQDLQAKPLIPADMKSLYEDFSEQKDILKNMFQNVDEIIIKKAYQEFIIKNLNVNYNDETIEEVINFLEKSSQGDRVFLKKQKAESLLKDWELDYFRNQQIQMDKPTNNEEKTFSREMSSIFNNDKELDNVFLNFEPKSQSAFRKLVSKRPDIKAILYEILKEEA